MFTDKSRFADFTEYTSLEVAESNFAFGEVISNGGYNYDGTTLQGGQAYVGGFLHMLTGSDTFTIPNGSKMYLKITVTESTNDSVPGSVVGNIIVSATNLSNSTLIKYLLIWERDAAGNLLDHRKGLGRYVNNKAFEPNGTVIIDAGDIPASDPTGGTGDDIQEVLGNLNDKITTAAGGGILTINGESPDANLNIDIPLSPIHAYDIGFVDGDGGTTMNGIIETIINKAIAKYGNQQQLIINIKASQSLFPTVYEAMQFTITSTNKFSAPDPQYLDLEIKLLKTTFTAPETTSRVTIYKNQDSGYYTFLYDYDTYTGIKYESIMNEKGEYGDIWGRKSNDSTTTPHRERLLITFKEEAYLHEGQVVTHNLNTYGLINGTFIIENVELIFSDYDFDNALLTRYQTYAYNIKGYSLSFDDGNATGGLETLHDNNFGIMIPGYDTQPTSFDQIIFKHGIINFDYDTSILTITGQTANVGSSRDVVLNAVNVYGRYK